MKILQIAENLYLESGGPTKVIGELAEILNLRGVETTVFSTIRRKKKANVYPLVTESAFFEQNFLSFFWPGYSTDFSKEIFRRIKEFDVIHVHEIWHYPHYAACVAARNAGVPYIITPHGAVDSWCLHRRAFKKKVFFNVAEKKIFSEAAAVQALTQSEADIIKKLVPKSKVVQIPNGINLDDFKIMPNREEFNRAFNIAPEEKVILFLSRIDKKKGLDILARAFGTIACREKRVRLVIAGPDNSGYAREIKKKLEDEKATDKTIFCGNLSGKDKMAALARADIFVLPSYSEGFSMAILEAMACGIPAIFTKQCNFPEAGRSKAALVIDASEIQLMQAINLLLESFELRFRIGNNAKKLIEQDFSLDAISAKLISLYHKVAKI